MSSPARSRGLARGRHGRGIRSSLAGPYLPRLTGRVLDFELAVEDSTSYLRTVAPELMAEVDVAVAGMPAENVLGDGMDRWRAERRAIGGQVTLFRIPIERLEHLHCDDPVHLRALVERTLIDAVADLLGREPWDVAPDRYGD